mgnify:CR=1 FL=1
MNCLLVQVLEEWTYTISKCYNFFAGLSIVQNEKIPQFFFWTDQMDEIFQDDSSSSAVANLQKGLAKLEIL